MKAKQKSKRQTNELLRVFQEFVFILYFQIHEIQCYVLQECKK
jgi:hypothetical protein